MSKKIDFNFLHNFLQFIQAKNKWKISEILDNLDISFKELIYILDIVSQIYVDFDDIFIDYEINEDTEEINFLFNDSVYELLSINDSELFNLYYLLTIEANFLTLKDSNKEKRREQATEAMIGAGEAGVIQSQQKVSNVKRKVSR